MKNGQKYKTVEERSKAFKLFCKSHREKHDACGKCALVDFGIGCGMAWLDMEAETEKPLPCPYCEQPMRILPFARHRYRAECSLCGYASMAFHNIDEVVRCHNRVASAVKRERANKFYEQQV